MISNVTKKMYSMQVGSNFRLRNKIGEDMGLVIRVPSGWIYLYLFRGMPTSCFIPYTDSQEICDTSITINPCWSCKSTNVVLQSNIDDIKWEIRCDNCGASSGFRLRKEEVIEIWNSIKR